jgi:hypothetical protein
MSRSSLSIITCLAFSINHSPLSLHYSLAFAFATKQSLSIQPRARVSIITCLRLFYQPLTTLSSLFPSPLALPGVPGLFIGSLDAAFNQCALSALGITHVLSVAEGMAR